MPALSSLLSFLLTRSNKYFVLSRRLGFFLLPHQRERGRRSVSLSLKRYSNNRNGPLPAASSSAAPLLVAGGGSMERPADDGDDDDTDDSTFTARSRALPAFFGLPALARGRLHGELSLSACFYERKGLQRSLIAFSPRRRRVDDVLFGQSALVAARSTSSLSRALSPPPPPSSPIYTNHTGPPSPRRPRRQAA